MHDETISKVMALDRLFPLDQAIKGTYPDNISGLSYGNDQLTIHFLIDDNLAAILNMANTCNTLTLSATKLTINADGIDETVITGAGTDFECLVWQLGVLVAQATIADGSAEVSIGEVGSYLVECRQASGASGFIEIEAV